ncbi:helix-turn-helix domain-containing protein [Maricaulis parjimensis]|uniref:AraC-like ligand-binding domain-containing protein n=1 Tax=Maricaulis parjimensis TaxID=144023 RepID=UPI001939D7B9|nr:helix-turn-helix domain-containing protein [Maricaulis parjimensis]
MSGAPLVETSYFDTSALSVEDRFRTWREAMDVVFEVNPYDDRTRDHYFARVESFLLDDIAINHCALGAQTFKRDITRIARDGVDHYQLHVFLKGSVEMVCGGREVSAGVGDFVNLDHSETFASSTTDYEIINVFIPRRRLAPLLRAPDCTHGLVFDSRTGSGRLLRDYVLALNKAVAEISLAQAPQAAEALVQLAAMALNGVALDTADPPAVADHALLLNAQVFIKNNLSRPDLGPESLALALGLSRARLYRVFAACGGVMEFIREMRLRRAFTDLISPRHLHRHIAQIAYDWGFKDPAHFSRLFKARFGVSPRDAREQGARVMRDFSHPQVLPEGDTKYAYWIANIS